MTRTTISVTERASPGSSLSLRSRAGLSAAMPRSSSWHPNQLQSWSRPSKVGAEIKRSLPGGRGELASTPVLALSPEVCLGRAPAFGGQDFFAPAGPFARPMAPQACSFTRSPPPLASSHLVSALPGRTGPWLLSSQTPLSSHLPEQAYLSRFYEPVAQQGRK